jgi:CheY-like chemotaxis protein
MSESVHNGSGIQLADARCGEPVSSLRILVVDDDPMIGTLLEAMLKALGHSVCAIAGTQASAVADAARHKPELMIVDAWLGAGSGVAAMTEILKHGFIPHLFMSGNIAKVRLQRPDAIVLEKPFKESALIHVIQKAINISSAV